MAKAAGLTTFAVSDHDTLEGSRRAILKGAEAGVHVIPAVEISTALNGNVLHILGYYVDINNEPLAKTLQGICEYRIQRAKSLVENTNKELLALGKAPMDLQYILDIGNEKPITRSDIAQYLIDLGYVATKQEAFDRWLEKYNVPNKDLSLEETIQLIHGAGGVAVLAHPNSKFLSLWHISSNFAEITNMLTTMKAQGLDGVEVYRTEHTPEDQERYTTLAHSLGLALSGGSDFHGPHNQTSPEKIAAIDVPDSVAEVLETVSTKYKHV